MIIFRKSALEAGKGRVMATDRDNEYAMQVGKKGFALRSNPNFYLQHFGFQPAELADEFSQSTMELLGSVLNAMQSKVGF